MFKRQNDVPAAPSQEPSVPVTPEQLPYNAVTTTPTPATRVVKPTQKPLIGENVRINGDISFDGELIIEGLVKGDVTSNDPNANLVVQQSASIDGNVKVSTIQHNGTIRGSVESDGLLTVSNSGTVVGPVKYNQLVLEMGAVVNGSLEQVFSEAAPFDSAARTGRANEA